MSEASRSASATWEGDLIQGHGKVSTESPALLDAPITWPARVEAPEGKTSPEELIAAAHASCYAMALSNTLAEAGHPPRHLEVTSRVTAVLGADGLRITESALQVRGEVPGIDAAQFAQFADEGEAACPVSNALRGSVHIVVDAALIS